LMKIETLPGSASRYEANKKGEKKKKEKRNASKDSSLWNAIVSTG
jgi:hypothetical protein